MQTKDHFQVVHHIHLTNMYSPIDPLQKVLNRLSRWHNMSKHVISFVVVASCFYLRCWSMTLTIEVKCAESSSCLGTVPTVYTRRSQSPHRSPIFSLRIFIYNCHKRGLRSSFLYSTTRQAVGKAADRHPASFRRKKGRGRESRVLDPRAFHSAAAASSSSVHVDCVTTAIWVENILIVGMRRMLKKFPGLQRRTQFGLIHIHRLLLAFSCSPTTMATNKQTNKLRICASLNKLRTWTLLL